MNQAVIKTSNLFTFELDMGEGRNRPAGQQLEDEVFNCLTGTDAIHHPELWTVLDILREEGVTFSILSEPEQSAYKSKEGTRNEENTVEINSCGEVRYVGTVLGNVLNDRLADMLLLN